MNVIAINAAQGLLLLGVFIAVAVIAVYLIMVAAILVRVFNRLNIILGAVSEVYDKTAPMAPVIDEINADLTAGQQALEASVERLRQRRTQQGGGVQQQQPYA